MLNLIYKKKKRFRKVQMKIQKMKIEISKNHTRDDILKRSRHGEVEYPSLVIRG